MIVASVKEKKKKGPRGDGLRVRLTTRSITQSRPVLHPATTDVRMNFLNKISPMPCIIPVLLYVLLPVFLPSGWSAPSDAGSVSLTFLSYSSSIVSPAHPITAHAAGNSVFHQSCRISRCTNAVLPTSQTVVVSPSSFPCERQVFRRKFCPRLVGVIRSNAAATRQERPAVEQGRRARE